MKSKHIVDFKKKYGYEINELTKVYKNIISKRGVDMIISAAVKAYANGGDKIMTKREWSFARLASVILGRGARAVDKKVWDEYKIKN